MKQSGIYRIRNIVNGMLYIGSAINFTRRWWQHRQELRDNIHHSPRLQNAWNKYGAEAFEFEIVELVLNRNQLMEREQYWLDYYDSSNKEKGYNIVQIVTSPMLGRKHTEETKKLMSLAHLGKKQSPEHIKNAAESHRGKIRTEEQRKHCGRVWTDEQKKKQSEILEKYWIENPPSDIMRQTGKEASFKRWAKVKKMEN